MIIADSQLQQATTASLLLNQQGKTLRFNASQTQIALLIADLITQGATSPTLRTFTMNLLVSNNIPLQPKSMSQLDTVYDFINKQIRYVSDIKGIESLHTADFILQNQYGDCDDKSILAGAMLKTLGYDIALVFLDVEGTYDFQHIYLWVAFGGKWHAFDACIENATSGVGAEVQHFKRKKVMPIY